MLPVQINHPQCVNKPTDDRGLALLANTAGYKLFSQSISA